MHARKCASAVGLKHRIQWLHCGGDFLSFIAIQQEYSRYLNPKSRFDYYCMDTGTEYTGRDAVLPWALASSRCS